MGKEGDIIRLECEVIRNSHYRALTPEQWTAFYAVKFRNKVNDILLKTGKLPTVERIIMEIDC